MTGEQGFTYVELAVALSLVVLLVPVVFSLGHMVEAEMKEGIGRQQLQEEASAFVSDVRDELRRGSHFRLSPEGWLLFDLPTGETIRYKHDRRRVIRSVRKPGETRFSGTTVLLQEVYFAGFYPDKHGVWLDLGLQNWYADLNVKTYVRGRVKNR
ncbi:hypothetical protein CLV97_105124 [Planifilum fimeticola]|uniref:Prepilin-type N-terminal cleavage/methylation domain-containing protein n=1 Tax=Planifilum fimeticola TaxID=201975 RepID=A0A2T0LH71_9BACL|nr:hypothetical protein CLV97_105124 [Planifilum fimeticola]